MTKTKEEQVVGVELEPTDALVDGWMLFRLTKVWGSVKMNLSGVTRELGNSIEPAHGTQLRVVIPQHPGVGPQPENTITFTEVEDIGTSFLSYLEQTILNNHERRQQEKEGSW